MSIGKKTRFEVFKRDEFTCQYCGRRPPNVTLEVDHVIPRAKGGDDNQVNLVTSCFDCNRGKGARSLDEVPPAVSEELRRRKELRGQVDALSDFLEEERSRETKHIRKYTRRWRDTLPKQLRDCEFPPDRHTSLRTFLRRLPPSEVADAIDIAHLKRPACCHWDEPATWKYFCGVCWHKIKDAS